jgi:threonine aldolase
MVHAPAPYATNVPVRVNLYSDTQTKPSRAMKEAMMEAEVGDDQAGSDPTINALNERMAHLLGKEAAVFLPSGTMCNEIAILTQCRPGDEILGHKTCHILHAEGGAPWALAGVQVTGLEGENGMFGVPQLDAALRAKTRNAPPQRMVEVEQTANLGGGAVWSLDDLRAVADWSHEHGLVTHMDGARLMNAVVESGDSARDMAEGWDSVWLDFTKGLGAPLGAVLAGTHEFIGDAWRWKQRMGGAMRQGGICAAACLYALDHNVERLAEDHANARALARGLSQVPGLRVEPVHTNLVYVDTSAAGLEAAEVARRARDHGILVSVMGRYRVRACTHLDVDAAGIEEAIQVIRTVVGNGHASSLAEAAALG